MNIKTILNTFIYLVKNFGKIIRFVIALCVFIIFISLARWIVLPHIKVGIPSLPPVEVTDSIWQTTMAALIQLVGWALLIFFILWIIYQILRKIPLIGPILIKAFGFIFGPCRSSGIFGLYDTLFRIIFSNLSLSDRAARFFRGLMDFSKGSIGFILTTGGDLVPNIDLTGKGKNKRTESDIDKKINDEDNQFINDQYNMCLQENLIEITPEMTKDDKSFATAKNQTTRTICKTRQLQGIMDTIIMKI